jgi:monofunctional biosynthetic peptidoglycan transglycosylase
MQNALERNKDKGKVVAGGSTISQQLAKNLFLYNKRSFIRKGQEAVATWMMERMWTKQRILEVYLNSVEFGDNIYGVEAATQHYFGKSSRSLSREQAAFIAAILPNPKYYDENRQDRKLNYRKRMIQKYMRYSHIPD